MSIPPDPDSGRPDFQPATPPQAPATPPFVEAQPPPSVDVPPPWLQPGMYPGVFPAPLVAAPQRPSSATAASVLGIVGGSLGLLFGIMMMLGGSAMLTSSAGDIDTPVGATLIVFGLVIMAAAVMLLVSGITHLKGRGHVVLTVGAALQLLLALFTGAGALSSRGTASPLLLMALVGVALAISTLILTYTSSARAWRQWGRQCAPRR